MGQTGSARLIWRRLVSGLGPAAQSLNRHWVSASGPGQCIGCVSASLSWRGAAAAAGKPRGYAFIEYEAKADMKTAYKMADGKKIEGRRVTVDVERGRTVPNWRAPRQLPLVPLVLFSEESSVSPFACFCPTSFIHRLCCRAPLARALAVPLLLTFCLLHSFGRSQLLSG